MNTQKKNEIINDARMAIISELEDMTGDIFCDCERLNKVILKSFDLFSKEKEQEIVKKAIEVVLNNSIPSNEQMNIVRALRKLTPSDREDNI